MKKHALISILILTLLLPSVSVGQSKTQENSTNSEGQSVKESLQRIEKTTDEIRKEQKTRQTDNREELVSLLERTTAEVKDSRRLLKAYEKRESALVAQIDEYKRSAKILDEAYVAAVNELAELRVEIRSLRNAIAEKDKLIEVLKERVAKLEKRVSSLRRKVVYLAGAVFVLGALLFAKH